MNRRIVLNEADGRRLSRYLNSKYMLPPCNRCAEIRNSKLYCAAKCKFRYDICCFSCRRNCDITMRGKLLQDDDIYTIAMLAKLQD